MVASGRPALQKDNTTEEECTLMQHRYKYTHLLLYKSVQKVSIKTINNNNDVEYLELQIYRTDLYKKTFTIDSMEERDQFREINAQLNFPMIINRNVSLMKQFVEKHTSYRISDRR